ncbi:MAG: helix-turn-helix domain-containing protein [Gammaproteobacteria bacterium]|jgi:excisionase family DNA binding protein|nr:helix-turn-helix domain-containing protein [Gammaproteobacteria bacterium]
MNKNTLQKKEFYTPSEIAEVLPISKLSVYKALQRGDIHSIRIGKKIIIPAESFNKIFSISN